MMPQRPKVAYSPDLAPFVRLLCDEGILDGYRPLIEPDLKTSKRVQHLAYFAVRHFDHPGLEYTYSLFEEGPLAMDLFGDLGYIDDALAASPPDRSYWPRIDEFRRFAANHDRNWIEMAASLSRFNDLVNEGYSKPTGGRDRRTWILRMAELRYLSVDPNYIIGIYDEIKDTFLPISSSYRGGRCI